MGDSLLFDPFSYTDVLIPLSITPGIVNGLFWVLLGVTGVVVLILAYHLSSYSVSGIKASILIAVQAGVSILLLLATFSASVLFGS